MCKSMLLWLVELEKLGHEYEHLSEGAIKEDGAETILVGVEENIVDPSTKAFHLPFRALFNRKWYCS